MTTLPPDPLRIGWYVKGWDGDRILFEDADENEHWVARAALAATPPVVPDESDYDTTILQGYARGPDRPAAAGIDVDPAFLLAELKAADEAASVAHDYIWEERVTRDEGSEAIWDIHNKLRPLIERLSADSATEDET